MPAIDSSLFYLLLVCTRFSLSRGIYSLTQSNFLQLKPYIIISSKVSFLSYSDLLSPLQGECTAAKVVCGHDSDSYLRRSSCSLWSHRRYHPLIPCRPISRRLEGFIYGTRVICHCIQSVLFSVNISSGIMLSLLHLCNIILLFCEDKPS